jgi:hypothetical protein
MLRISRVFYLVDIRFVGIVRLQTKSREVCLLVRLFCLFVCFCLKWVLSNKLRRRGAFRYSPEDRQKFSFRNIVLSSFQNTGRWAKSKNPMIVPYTIVKVLQNLILYFYVRASNFSAITNIYCKTHYY